MNKVSKRRKRAAKLKSLEQINIDAAGIDIGSAEIFVCVPEGRHEESVRRFDTFTCELYKIAE